MEPYPEPSAWLSNVDKGVFSGRPSLDIRMDNVTKVAATNSQSNLLMEQEHEMLGVQRQVPIVDDTYLLARNESNRTASTTFRMPLPIIPSRFASLKDCESALRSCTRTQELASILPLPP